MNIPRQNSAYSLSGFFKKQLKMENYLGAGIRNWEWDTLIMEKFVLNRLSISIIILIAVSFYIYGAVSSETLYAEAVEFYDSEKYNEAIEILDLLVREFPDNSWVDASYYLIGDSYMKRGEHKKARENFFYIIEHFDESPLLPDAYFFTGKTYEEEERYEEMIYFYKYFLLNFPESYWKNDALQSLKKLETKEPERYYEVLFAISESFLEKKMKTNAIVYLKELAGQSRVQNFKYKSALLLGDILFEDRNPESALRYLNAIPGHSEFYIRAMLQKGEILFHRKRYEESLQCYNTVIEKSSDPTRRIEAMYMAGENLLILDRNSEAEKIFSRLVKDHPDSEWSGRSQNMLTRISMQERPEPVKIHVSTTEVEKQKAEEIALIAEKMQKEKEGSG